MITNLLTEFLLKIYLRLSFLSLVKICNHKRLGIYYLLSSIGSGITFLSFTYLLFKEINY